MTRSSLILLLLAGSACSEVTAHGRAVDQEARFAFELVETSTPRVSAQGQRWLLRHGNVMVAVQRIPLSDGFVRERHLNDVAAALARRYALTGTGMFPYNTCQVAGAASVCADGTVDSAAGVTYVRRSILRPEDGGFVLVEVTGPPAERAAVDEQYTLIKTTWANS